MGERRLRLFCGQLWRIPLSNGSLPTSDRPPAVAKVCAGGAGRPLQIATTFLRKAMCLPIAGMAELS